MKKLEMLFIMIFLLSPFTILSQNDKNREMTKYDFGEFTMEIPSNCEHNSGLCKTAHSSSYYISPSKDFVFILFECFLFDEQQNLIKIKFVVYSK